MPDKTPPVLDVDGLTVAYDRHPVLDGLDLTVRQGESVALTGSNGSGKSTLIKAVLGLTAAQSGAIRLFGTDRRRFKSHSRVGYVPQRSTLHGNIPVTVKETVAAGRLNRRLPGLPPRAADRRAVRDAIASVDLAELADRPMSDLSGGQQQRAYIARALAGEPELLIMDEPTVGVDAGTQELLARVVADRLDHGCTLLLVTHETGPLNGYLTRTVHLHGGEKAYDGPTIGLHGHDDEPACLHPGGEAEAPAATAHDVPGQLFEKGRDR
ncbi:metal ABC transporter ATP-binding protein [Salininema proteolyticum]|uniref:Metal ABC transporter ATP-binding protein n=1 Tax=Salininema proteolyticum TaxID=1607685 RepID=A0ABV8TT24_9ACTN